MRPSLPSNSAAFKRPLYFLGGREKKNGFSLQKKLSYKMKASDFLNSAMSRIFSYSNF
jgi:hypothetical protein